MRYPCSSLWWWDQASVYAYPYVLEVFLKDLSPYRSSIIITLTSLTFFLKVSMTSDWFPMFFSGARSPHLLKQIFFFEQVLIFNAEWTVSSTYCAVQDICLTSGIFQHVSHFRRRIPWIYETSPMLNIWISWRDLHNTKNCFSKALCVSVLLYNIIIIVFLFCNDAGQRSILFYELDNLISLLILSNWWKVFCYTEGREQD